MVLSLFQNYRHKKGSALLTEEKGVTFVSAVILVAVMSLSIWASLVLSDVILKAKSISTTEDEMQIIVNGLLSFYRDCDQFVTDSGDAAADFLDLETQPLAARFEGTASLQSYRQSVWDGPYVRGGYDEDKDGDTVDFIQEYFKDAWNKPYIYDYTAGATTATITSYGLNRAAGGGDDVVITITANDVVEEKIRNTKGELAYINARKEELETRYDNAGETFSPVGFDIDNLFQTYGCDTTGLISHWKMDEGSWDGVAPDAVDSQGSNDGTAYGGVTTVFTGKLGRCGSFDGVDDYVNIPGYYLSTATAGGAIESWFNKAGDSSGSNSAGGIFSNGGSSRPLVYVLNTENIQIYWSGASGMLVGGGEYTNTYSISEDEWYHVVFSWTEDHYYLYLNAVLKEDNAFIPSTPISGDSLIGKYSADNVLNGFIDEVRIWSRALPASDVFQEYLRGVYLTDWAYKYDEWQSEYAWDSGNGVFYSFGPDRVTGGDDDIYQSE